MFASLRSIAELNLHVLPPAGTCKYEVYISSGNRMSKICSPHKDKIMQTFAQIYWFRHLFIFYRHKRGVKQEQKADVLRRR